MPKHDLRLESRWNLLRWTKREVKDAGSVEVENSADHWVQLMSLVIWVLRSFMSSFQSPPSARPPSPSCLSKRFDSDRGTHVLGQYTTIIE
jgi:hypothetical protein